MVILLPKVQAFYGEVNIWHTSKIFKNKTVCSNKTSLSSFPCKLPIKGTFVLVNS